MLRYLNRYVMLHKLRPMIRCRAKVIALERRADPESLREEGWVVRWVDSSTGETQETACEWVVHSCGCYSTPTMPLVPGQATSPEPVPWCPVRVRVRQARLGLGLGRAKL